MTTFQSEAARARRVRRPRADVVMLDRDLTKIAPETIAESHLMVAIVGGRIAI